MVGRTLSILGFGFAYFVAVAASIVLAKFDGGVAVAWLATALLAAKLLISPRDRWLELALISVVASVCATGQFGLGWSSAWPLAVVNVGEALIAAIVMRVIEQRVGKSGSSIYWFFLASALVSPAISAIPGAFLIDHATNKGFFSEYRNWYISRSLGMLLFAPVLVQWMRGDVARWLGSAFLRRDLGAMALLSVTVITIIATFSQNTYPLLFLPVLALVGFTIRTGYVGATIGNVLLAMIGGYFTSKGWGPIALTQSAPDVATQFMQFYVGATALTLLLVATILNDQRLASALLSDSEMRYRMLADNVTDIVIATDVNGIVTYISPSISQYGNYTVKELIGKSALELIDPGFHEIVRENHVRMLKAQATPVIVEYVGVTRDGRCRWFETIGRSLLDETGMAIGVVGTVRETTGRRRLENELSIAAQRDVLTGLPNRRAFFDVARSLEATREPGCLAVIDLDNFKRVNDSHGHAAGDKVLRLFGQIGDAAIRSTDMLARLGGEEFAILLPGATMEQARVICQRILDNLANATMTQGPAKFHVTASAGLAEFDGTIDDALQRADAALYQAKDQGRARLALAA
ncbi:MAG: diguanylate cyclase [Novosphingobium sp.]